MEKESGKSDLENRINQIKNKNNNDLSKQKNKQEENQNNKSLDSDTLKNKIKLDNAPELKEVKDLDKNIKTIKQGFSSVSSSNTAITKEKFLNFIKQANEMSQDDKKRAEEIFSRNKLEQLCLDLKNNVLNGELKNKLSDINKKLIVDKSDAIQKWLKSNKNASKGEYENKYEEFLRDFENVQKTPK